MTSPCLRIGLTASAVVLLSSQASSVLACYCDRTPFSRVAATAEFVVIGKISKTSHGQVPLKAGQTWASQYWVSTVEIIRVVKGTPPKPFLVGGYGSSCDFAEPVFRAGDTYAFAFTSKLKTPQAFYWVEMCTEGAIGILGESEHGEFSLEQVVRWAQGGPTPRAKRPQNKRLQRTSEPPSGARR